MISVVRKIWKCKFKVECKGENWIYLAENRVVVNTITNFRIAKIVGNFWTRCGLISFPQRDPLC
jgi:hypothetical protein